MGSVGGPALGFLLCLFCLYYVLFKGCLPKSVPCTLSAVILTVAVFPTKAGVLFRSLAEQRNKSSNWIFDQYSEIQLEPFRRAGKALLLAVSILEEFGFHCRPKLTSV